MNHKEIVGMNVKIHAMNYQITGVIGEGAASIVYSAKNQTGKYVAIKKIKDYKNPIIKEAVDKQIKIQKTFEGCPYVIQYLGVQIAKNEVFIALELGEYTLRKSIEMKNLAQSELIKMINDALEALYHIHENDVIHRDIKPENIIFKEGTFKITDFGVSSEACEDQKMVGTCIYFPPEMIFQGTDVFTQKVDTWSLGVSAFESYFLINPFYYSKGKARRQVLEEMKANIQALTPKFTMQKFLGYINNKGLNQKAKYVQKKLYKTKKEVINNLCSFFQPNPQKRPHSSQLLMFWRSIKDSKSQFQCIKKTKLRFPFQREDLPPDIEIFCRAKDMFYEINEELPYSEQLQLKKLKVLQALEFSIWYLQGKLYKTKYIVIDSIKKIKQQQPPQEKLWTEIKSTLLAFYYLLNAEEENISYSKINEMKLYVLVCGVWRKIIQEDEDFRSMVKKITNFETLTIEETLTFSKLFTENNFKQIEEKILIKYYFQQ